MRWVFISLIAIFIFSCNSNDTSREAQNDETSPAHVERKDSTVAPATDKESNSSSCYWKILQRDTFALHLEQSSNEVTGKLTFNNFQKDKSSGIVQGKIEGDIVKLWYSFQSEGMQSVMEVYFKKQGDHLVRGLGPVEVKGDSTFFKNDNDIDYKNDQIFFRKDCSIFPSKYR